MTDPRSDTISRLLAAGADDRPAIEAPGRPALSYMGLREHAGRVLAALNGMGIGRGDRVAIVLPNGPELATAFATVAVGATTAPLNPGYRDEEFEFYLSDLKARALIVEAGSDSLAVAVARRLGILVIELHAADGAAAGVFELRPTGETLPPSEIMTGAAEPDDIALVLHTSGTTSRPKIVPLSQRNVTASAGNIRDSLCLTADDRCLNIMPLFHIHGLVAAVLASLRAGASICCTSGFNALKFFTWMADVKPTWYTAVPTMHQAILGRAGRNQAVIDRVHLRFIRSSSASLPPQVMAALEDVFGCPVVEAYGMTEASHQMASNPLPPAVRKPSTVGLAAGPEVAVMAADGTLMPAGAVGEVVIRGENVTAGYESNAEANASAFSHGWFHTGDQGTMDVDGYVKITGRLKEIINRGGEKVSPLEVDGILLDHPAVAQAVTFAMPHAKLGEEVAAAVVLRDGEATDESSLRDFAAGRLADFKVPRKILFLDEIPKGATGKIQRIGLAEKLGLGS